MFVFVHAKQHLQRSLQMHALWAQSKQLQLTWRMLVWYTHYLLLSSSLCLFAFTILLTSLTKIAHSIISVLKSVSCCALFAFRQHGAIRPSGTAHWRLRSVLVDVDDDTRPLDADRGATEWSSCGSWHAAFAATAATDYQLAKSTSSCCSSWHVARGATDCQRDGLGRESALGDLPVGPRRASCHR